ASDPPRPRPTPDLTRRNPDAGCRAGFGPRWETGRSMTSTSRLVGPIEPEPSRWVLPSPERADEDGVCGIGADLEPGTILEAYRSGLFPMPIRRSLLAW